MFIYNLHFRVQSSSNHNLLLQQVTIPPCPKFPFLSTCHFQNENTSTKIPNFCAHSDATDKNKQVCRKETSLCTQKSLHGPQCFSYQADTSSPNRNRSCSKNKNVRTVCGPSRTNAGTNPCKKINVAKEQPINPTSPHHQILESFCQISVSPRNKSKFIMSFQTSSNLDKNAFGTLKNPKGPLMAISFPQARRFCKNTTDNRG